MTQQSRQRIPAALDIAIIVSILAVAALLRSNVSYRTAFIDEAINLYQGWRMLQGQETFLIRYHMGWPVLSAVPLGFIGSLAGLEAARAFNAVLGVATVTVTMMTARALYGRLAGYIAGGIGAVYGPAVFVSTVVTYDSLSVLLVSVALYLWVRALSEDRLSFYALGSLAMTFAVFTKYAAVMVALAAVISALLTAGAAVARDGVADSRRSVRRRDVLLKLLVTALPFLLLLIYAWLYRTSLLSLVRTQVVTKAATEQGAVYEITSRFVSYLWLPLLLAAAAVFVRGRRAAGIGLLLVGVSMIPYHLANRDESTLFKHTCYMLLGLAPLSAGTIVEGVKAYAASRLSVGRRSLIGALLGLVLVGYIALLGHYQIPGLRSYWPDTTELMAYLRSEVQQGDALLMEGGVVAGYYLVEKGVPGHIPAEIVDTWSYQDAEGSGTPAFRRALSEGRFDFVVLSDVYTPAFNKVLRRYMEGQYKKVKTFSTVVSGGEKTLEVYVPIQDDDVSSTSLVA